MQAERQQRWLLVWLLTGVILFCVAAYPLAVAFAHALDEAEKPPLLFRQSGR